MKHIRAFICNFMKQVFMKTSSIRKFDVLGAGEVLLAHRKKICTEV